ncbi:MAG: hypothetical protein DMF88_03065 [Acidobacteria bacterium]|nr:MAG: hypothetical protein DMF88_03065 [Acidobacteriota bacterium]
MLRPFRPQVRAAPSGAAAIGVLLLLACGSGSCRSTTSSGDPAARDTAQHDVVIAVAWPWERRTQIHYGEGLDLAVEEENAGGGLEGRRIRVVRYDDGESIDEGRLVAERIAATPGVAAVIGHLQSYVTLPAASIYERAGLVLLAPVATDPALTSSGYRHVFRVTLSVTDIGRHLADTAARFGFRRIAIHYSRTDYGRDLSNAFETRAAELGLAVPVRQSYDASDSIDEPAIRSAMRQWADVGVDAVFLAGEPPTAANMLVLIRQAGVRLPLLAGDAMSSPEVLDLAGPAAEGIVVASFFHPDEPRPEVKAFTRAFRQRYGMTPDVGSALGYDAVRLIAHAVRESGSTAPAAIAAALHATRDWQGVTGAFTFDERGETVNKRLIEVKVRGGHFVFLDQRPVAATVGP